MTVSEKLETGCGCAENKDEIIVESDCSCADEEKKDLDYCC